MLFNLPRKVGVIAKNHFGCKWFESRGNCNGESGKDILDASSGLGLGTQALRAQGFNVDDVEPFQSNERLNSEKGLLPATFKSYDDLKKKYDVVISNAVLNVIPDDWRAGVVKQMADATKAGGKMIVNVRGANEVDGIKNKIELESPYELLIPKGNNEQGQPTYAYQRFWTKPEFRDYMQQQLGDDWKVEIGNEANSGTKSGTVAVCYKVKDTAPEGGKKQAEGNELGEHDDAGIRYSITVPTLQEKDDAVKRIDKRIAELNRPKEDERLTISEGSAADHMKRLPDNSGARRGSSAAKVDKNLDRQKIWWRI